MPVYIGLLWLIRRPSLSWQFVEGWKPIPVLDIKINNSYLQTPCDFHLLNLVRMFSPFAVESHIYIVKDWRSYSSPWQQHKLHFFILFFFFTSHCKSCSSYIERSILSWQKTDLFLCWCIYAIFTDISTHSSFI